ncbi:hypothetical protein U9M48_011287 [Paspalum notatum var. saurae]|uniref:Reverse transcriptase Ty1/copia-type domain-containing protein n=1 Tax=Paspalum notatum var. saurae TaxID=547442 RepID=A0AAQ3WHB2_PASNO
MESRDATFFENIFSMKDTPSTSSQESSVPHEPIIHVIHAEPSNIENPIDEDIEVTRKSKRERISKSFGDDFIVYLVDDTPRTIKEAYSSQDADYWKEAIRSEMDSIMANGTWDIVERPYGCNPVGCKWVFKKKLRPDGTIKKYKARLVAKGTTSYGIHYSGYPRVLEGYSDSNWISDADELKATSGYIFTLGGGAVSWKSCKQTILTRSVMEAELTALDTASVEADWLRELVMDLPVVEEPVPAILMNCDNQTVIAKVNSSKDNIKSSRHVKRRLKSIRKMKTSGVIALDYGPTTKNLADPFTKGLSRKVIDEASREMGMRPTLSTHTARQYAIPTPKLASTSEGEDRASEAIGVKEAPAGIDANQVFGERVQPRDCLVRGTALRTPSCINS